MRKLSWYELLSLCFIVGFGLFMGTRPPTPTTAQRFYLAQGKDACLEAMLLVQPVMDQETRAMVSHCIQAIGNGPDAPTPMRVINDLDFYARSDKLSAEQRKAFGKLRAAIVAAAYLPFQDQFAKTEEEKAEFRKNFAASFRKVQDCLGKALLESRKARGK